MRIIINKPGVLTTVQDLGRDKYMAQAVPLSGAMDRLSARIANMVVGNDDNSAVIEFTYANASFTAGTDVLIAYAGDGAILKASAKTLPAERPIFIPVGTKIDLFANQAGSRTYLSIAGGWDAPEVMSSRSTYITAGFGGFKGRLLKANDVLNSIKFLDILSEKLLRHLKGEKINFTRWSLPRHLLLKVGGKAVRVVPGPEFSWFKGHSVYDFFTEKYTLDRRSNRMGYHLDGPNIERVKIEELLSTALVPGTIQVTGDGKLILLMADCQTTGGYARIAQVAAVDLALCGQLKPGDNIYFKEISLQEAERLYIEQEEQMQRLTTAINYKI